jgi:hypothetical protein
MTRPTATCELRYNWSVADSSTDSTEPTGTSDPTLVTCDDCSRVSFAVTREYAEDEVRRFNAYYETLDSETQSHFGGPSSLDNYVCLSCGGSSFHPATVSDQKRAEGHTVNPVVVGLAVDRTQAIEPL